MSDRFRAELTEALPRLRRYAIALAGDVPTADDLVQDCLERAWRHRDTLRPGGSVLGWLRAILHNANVDRVRRRRRRPDEAESLDGVAGLLAGAGPPQDAPAAMDVARAMRRLSVEHRQVVLLTALEGLSYRETADELGVPVGTVMSRLARARARLRALLEGADD